MNPVSDETILKQLNWRYAVKNFDPARKIPPAQWATLEQALILAPSSFGLQPWRFYVIDDVEMRQKLIPVSWGQTQVFDASHLVVFAIRKNLDAEFVDRFLDRHIEIRGGDRAALAGYRKLILKSLEGEIQEAGAHHWAARQAYIALGQFMTTAAMLGIDTCPMEGLEADRYDEILGLAEQGYATVCACPAGYRSANDKYQHRKKVRFAAKDVVVHVG